MGRWPFQVACRWEATRHQTQLATCTTLLTCCSWTSTISKCGTSPLGEWESGRADCRSQVCILSRCGEECDFVYRMPSLCVSFEAFYTQCHALPELTCRKLLQCLFFPTALWSSAYLQASRCQPSPNEWRWNLHKVKAVGFVWRRHS